RTYSVGKSTITVRFDDITTSRAEVPVSSDDTELTMGGGVSAAIARAAGAHLAVEARAKLVPARTGDVVVTQAGNLSAKYIFHIITMEAFPSRRTSNQDAAPLE